MLEERNVIMRRGTIIDASIIQASRKFPKKEGNKKVEEKKKQFAAG